MPRYDINRLKDSATAVLQDEGISVVDGELETAIMETLVVDRAVWPRRWNSASFAPTDDVADALELISVAFPERPWSLKMCRDGKYEAYVGDETFSVFSFTPARTLVLAAWNAHNFDEMEK